jgi:hypothetical protein
MARRRFERGVLQRGSGADVVVKFKGTQLLVHGQEPGGSREALFVWDSGQPIARVSAVYLSKRKDVVAVEYATRFGGRTVDDLIAFRLRASLKASVGPGGSGSAAVSTKAGDPTAAAVSDSETVQKHLAKGTKLQKRRKHRKAIEEFEKVLAERADHPKALFLWAKSAMALKDRRTVVEKLKALRSSKHPEARHFCVEARFDKAFKALRGDKDFRLAVGIDEDPALPRSAYERLVGLGGKWEQEGLACDQPQVNLTLARNRKRRFDLVIRSNCQGVRETTRLDGQWAAAGRSSLHLVFPNPGQKDEKLACELELCSDGSGEDCLRCQPEPDIEFLFRPVRR